MKPLVHVLFLWIFVIFSASAEDPVLSLVTGFGGVMWDDRSEVIKAKFPDEDTVVSLGAHLSLYGIGPKKAFLVQDGQVVGACFGPVIEYDALTGGEDPGSTHGDWMLPIADGIGIGMLAEDFERALKLRIKMESRPNSFFWQGVFWRATFADNINFEMGTKRLTYLTIFKRRPDARAEVKSPSIEKTPVEKPVPEKTNF